MYLKLSYKKSILSGVQDLAHAVRKLAVINRLLFLVSSGIVELLTSCSNYRYDTLAVPIICIVLH